MHSMKAALRYKRFCRVKTETRGSRSVLEFVVVLGQNVCRPSTAHLFHILSFDASHFLQDQHCKELSSQKKVNERLLHFCVVVLVAARAVRLAVRLKRT